MTQQSGNPIDDDLTASMDNNESFSTESVDLFGFSGGEESPIARLKTIILSIDWEINDNIMQQLDDELMDLSDVWAGDKIKQVYIQGLSKIGKYINKEKANAHPNAIKLLISFYHNFEKIVSTDDLLGEAGKKQLLLEDVKKFEELKSQIGQLTADSAATESLGVSHSDKVTIDTNEVEQLQVLKAQILGIDWEINDEELQKLSDEVQRLETVFSQSKAKLILLQGIGTLSSYINKKRSQSNKKAFSLLHSFCDVLEKISAAELSTNDENQLLFSEVEKFKAFKKEIVEPQPQSVQVEDEDALVESLPVENAVEEEKVASDVDSRLSSVFDDIDDNEEEEAFGERAALDGVDVETEADDESDEEALLFADGVVAPALSDVEEESSFSVEKLAGDLAESSKGEEGSADADAEREVESLFQGVDVETEADDDSDEEALPFEGGEIAPALSGSDGESGFDEESLSAVSDESDSEDLDNRLSSFFDDEVQSSSSDWSGEPEEEYHELEEESHGDVEEALDFLDDDAPASALSDVDEDTSVDEEIVEDRLSFFDDEVPAPRSDDAEDFNAPDQLEEDDAAENLSFLDEDIPAPHATEPEEALPDDIVDTEDEQLSFYDEAVTPALSDETDSFLTEEDVEEVGALSDDETETALVEKTEELIVDESEETLSFLDEEIEPPVIEEKTFETEETEFDNEEEVLVGEEIEFAVPGEEDSATDAPTIPDEIHPEAGDDDVIEVMVPGEDTSEIVATESAEVDSEAVAEVEVESVPDVEESVPFAAEDDEEVIEFMVPGEDISEVVATESAEVDSEAVAEVEVEPVPDVEESVSFAAEDDEEAIEFMVPGEDISEVVATESVEVDSEAVAEVEVEPLPDVEESVPFAAADDEEVIEFMVPGEEISKVVETESDAVIFEAVADDVEIDALPGEEYTDSITIDRLADEEGVQFAVEESGDYSIAYGQDDVSSDEYKVLESNISSLQECVTADILQSVLSEINRLRQLSISSDTQKIFLQLLSAVCQHIERDIATPDAVALSLMSEVFEGVRMTSSSDAAPGQIQQHLLMCTGQVLLLQQQNICRLQDAMLEDKASFQDTEVEFESDEEISDEKRVVTDSLESDDPLAVFVQKELADIRTLFLDEIKTLRKELVG